MSTKSQRSVAFQTPADTSSSSTPGPTEDKTYSVPMAVLANMKEASRSRCRARSRSWSRFRSRRSKSQDARSSDPGLGQSPKRDLSVVGLVRTASRNSVRSLVKLFESRWMNEGRKTQIVLLDERRLDIIIQPKLYSNDLLDLVASHFKLKEKHYFGLGFFDDTNNFNWLQGDRRVLDHEFPKKTGLLILHFSIRSYVETIGLLRDSQTVELFYLNARLGVFRGQIECEAEIIFELAAHVLQATCGDFVSNEEAKEDLKKLPVIPTCTLKKHPSIAYCEERVIFYYEKLSGTSRGLAIVNYMNIIEKLPTYGIHYYNVKDKKDIPWWLGISPKGIAVYDINDKTTPRKLFTWKNLENLYYRDKKFSIEVHGPKRIIHTLSSFNPYEDAVREPAESKDDLSTAITDPTTQVSVSRRTFGASNVDVHAWFTTTAQLTKCIWNMAVAQHQFYLDRKQSKGQIPVVRTMSDIAADLCSSSTSLPGSTGSDLSRSPSSHSLPSLSNSRYDLSIEQSDSIKAERDMYQALKARKEALEDALKKKMEELKLLCIQEGELTGELPKETPLSYGEAVPVFRRRIGTSFSLSAKNVDDVNNLSNELSKLELEVELQGKITSAAQRLASDKTVSKYVHKQRKQSYSKALVKLKEMEKKLSEMHKQVGKSSGSSHHHHNRGRPSDEHEGTPANKLTSKDMSHQEVQDETANKTIISPSHSSPQLYSNQGTSQRQQHFIGLSGRGTKSVQSSDPSMSSHLTPHSRQDTSYESGFSSANNMYNVSSQRTSHYESADQLKSPATSEPGHIYSSLSSNDSALGLSKHGSGDEPFLRAAPNSSGSYLHYGSLDRKRQNYRQDALRDLSPVGYRSHNKGYAGHRMNSPETGGYKDPQSPSHIVDDHAPTVRHAWDQNASYKEDAHLKPGLNNYNPIHVYSPRMYEGALGRPYHDVDVTHVHSKEAHEHGLVGAHHTMSQPVFHRTERSLSPAKHQEVLYHRPHPPSGFESQHGVGSFQTVPEGYVPIQHVDKHFSSHHSDTHLSGHSHGTDTHIPIQFSSGHIRGTETHIPIQHSPGHLHGNETHIPIQHSTGNMYGTQAHIQQHPSGLVHGKETNIPIQHSPSPIPIPQNETRIPGHLPLQHSEGHSSGSQYSHVGSPSSPRSPASYASSTLVTVTQLQPHRELTKPYEISDFYRYSEKLRRQRIIDQYQRQLMGVDRMSRSSSPLSVDSDGHSSHSGSSSSNPVSHSPSHHQSVPFSGRGPLHTYIRSASAPLHSTLQPPLQTLPPPHPNHPEGQITSSASSYSVKSHGANMNYAMQSSVKVHQVHTAAKHSVYQPPQPMTCNPVRNPPYKKT
ncbi:FERM domain-containing protein 4A-like isoform X1 [Biomphalaria glabrata]|uniref:FERM domain-containing protein 4A-like isoform X1 n=1 Tax=Biomphalaria glabrata TaxID=6526 RepID=A0A9W3A2A8_BIOGL|nr:FERM domain-containing protein 4A-like isoform X1 [Biomphalaria glabrata]